MDTPSRTFAKAISWQALGLLVMTLVGWLLTGSAGTGGAMAAVSAIVGLTCYVLHERLWSRVRWGRLAA